MGGTISAVFAEKRISGQYQTGKRGQTQGTTATLHRKERFPYECPLSGVDGIDVRDMRWSEHDVPTIKAHLWYCCT
jgi:hypothetical protein